MTLLKAIRRDAFGVALIAEGALSAAIVRLCALISLCVYSSLVQATEWTLSGIGGAGNHVNVIGVEAQAPSGYDGTLSDQWSWALAWAGDVSCWWASNHPASNSSLWEAGITPVVNLRSVSASGGRTTSRPASASICCPTP